MRETSNHQTTAVSRLGLECLQLAGLLSDEEGIAVIKQAFDHGITFFDTADRYGPHKKNEILIGKVRSFSLILPLTRNLGLRGGKSGLFAGVEAIARREGPSSKREGGARAGELRSDPRSPGVEYIDLYYQHRVGLSVRIEDIGSTDLCIICFSFCRFQVACKMGELKKLVEEGKASTSGRRRRASTRSLLCRWSGLSGPATSKTRQ
ncbi:hypothetical protein BHM03_00019132 [Ensete ventricosum]|nr:hypothetical protein BHM03_00019132 [Ensete ventricosum]